MRYFCEISGLVPGRYDDGAFSGASLDRPAMQKLLADVRSRTIDIVLVYKVDRLTRSLADSIVGSLNTNVRVSTKPGQLHRAACL
jgi:DNA invertase Pin-like site-specific DNA recombinase